MQFRLSGNTHVLDYVYYQFQFYPLYLLQFLKNLMLFSIRFLIYYCFKLTEYIGHSRLDKLVYLAVFHNLSPAPGNSGDILISPPELALFKIGLFDKSGDAMLYRLGHDPVENVHHFRPALEQVIVHGLQFVQNLQNKRPLAVILDDF